MERRTGSEPEQARKLLEAAYSWVRFSGSHSLAKNVDGAFQRVNAAVAGTIVNSFRHPENAVMVNIFFPCEMLHAMGIQPMFPEGISVYVANTACPSVFLEKAEDCDVPETFCSYHKLMLGMAETGVMPRPMMIANTTLACDANQLSFRRLAEFYDAPHVVVDVPHAIDEDAVAYVADQLRAVTPQLEDLSGRKLNPEALRDAIACSKRTQETYQRFLKKRSSVSLPTTMSSELCTMIADHVMLGRPEGEAYMKELLRAAEKAPAASSGKKRIFWMHTLPNWQDSMKTILEQSGKCELVGNDMAVDSLLEMDPEHPYESMARRVVENTFNGPAVRRIRSGIRYAKATEADGVILFCHWGCKQTMGLSQMAKQMMEAEGLPVLVLDGDGCDKRNVADGQMVTRINAFLEQLEGVSK